jgi:hypothetical protein
MHPSNFIMDGSAIENILPVFGVFVAAFRAVILHGKFQTLIPTVSLKSKSSLFFSPQQHSPC